MCVQVQFDFPEVLSNVFLLTTNEKTSFDNGVVCFVYLFNKDSVLYLPLTPHDICFIVDLKLEYCIIYLVEFVYGFRFIFSSLTLCFITYTGLLSYVLEFDNGLIVVSISLAR